MESCQCTHMTVVTLVTLMKYIKMLNPSFYILIGRLNVFGPLHVYNSRSSGTHGDEAVHHRKYEQKGSLSMQLVELHSFLSEIDFHLTVLGFDSCFIPGPELWCCPALPALILFFCSPTTFLIFSGSSSVSRTLIDLPARSYLMSCLEALHFIHNLLNDILCLLQDMSFFLLWFF